MADADASRLVKSGGPAYGRAVVMYRVVRDSEPRALRPHCLQLSHLMRVPSASSMYR